jgi:uncharacterized delta-60 repeat protein
VTPLTVLGAIGAYPFIDVMRALATPHSVKSISKDNPKERRMKTPLLTAVSALLFCASSSLVCAQTVPSVCTAGMLDTHYGPAASAGYVQSSPVMLNESEFEAGAFGSTNDYYTVSSAAMDMLGQPLAAIVKLKPGGARDLTYGGFGSVVPAPPTAGLVDASLAIDGSDRTVIGMMSADQTNIVLARYSSAGVLDASFGTGGELTIPFQNSVNGPWAVKAAADGTVFIATATATNGGPWQPIVVKVTSAGAIDTSFGVAGFASFYADNFGPSGKATDLWLNADGTILVGGRIGDNSTYNYFYVARLTSYGALDTSFGTNQGLTVVSFGDIIAYGRKMAVQTDGKIVLMGGIIPTNSAATANVTDTGVIRLLANGALDTTFNGSGVMHLTNVVYQMVALQNNNKILLGGEASLTTPTGLVARLLTNGQPDPAFGTTGNGTVPVAAPGSPNTLISRVSYSPGGAIIVHSGTGVAGVSAGAGFVLRLDSGSGPGCH